MGFYGLKYLYSVISVIQNGLPGNTQMWTIAPFVDNQSAISCILDGVWLDQLISLGGARCTAQKSYFNTFLKVVPNHNPRTNQPKQWRKQLLRFFLASN